MKTFADRKAMVKDLLTDPDLEITAKELLVYQYYWLRYEYSRLRLIQANRNIKKYANKLNNSTEVFTFRKSMNDL